MVPAIHGRTMMRFAKALAVGGSFSGGVGYASSQGWSDERVITSALRAKASADPVSADALMQPITSDFSAFLMTGVSAGIKMTHLVG